MTSASLGFVVRTELNKAATANGFRVTDGEADGWLKFKSSSASGTLFLTGAGDQGPWYVGLDHAGVVPELEVDPDPISGPGLARYKFSSLKTYYEALERIYQLSASLPDGPLHDFEGAIRDLPRNTEAERLLVQRVGQEKFRSALIDYWDGTCPLTGISDPALLRASHIRPWADCETDAERLNTYNGLLLSSLWDAAFDKGLVSFDDDGAPIYGPNLSEKARDALEHQVQQCIPIRDAHRERLAYHRQHVFQEED
ncbi:HNH endonuclease [Hyphobacterium sp. CCMP332]|uniref:HNH endonuclease n=1 Tax=Hyphobacterium sp. CCMP332 TaxID=2749086 RepID=UPI0016502DB9|nr:HNH endonuclease [Hyphobacterium sp. CCMP332]QNL18857.1 HNH endonuclease [Hyphobacterium sp. CCMP332]